jgi:phosphoesterase RecJ-like protein
VTPAFDRAAELIDRAESALLTSHRRPDGDGVGSMVALASLLESRGKRITLYTPDLVPRNLKWLPYAKKFVRRLKKDARYALTVVVDCADPKLLGPRFPPPEVTGPVVALDHHASARPFGDVFVCDPAAASVGVLVVRLAERLGWPIPEAAAKGIFVSLVADTGSFRYANANAEAFRIAAALIDGGGVDPWYVHERMHERVPVSRYRLLAAALGTLELVADGKLAFITVTEEMVKAASATWDDSEGIVNYARTISGVECGVLITPARGGGIRVSLRSKGREIDAGAVCLELGGGGHAGAAGCQLACSLAEARARIEGALLRALGVEPATAAPVPSAVGEGALPAGESLAGAGHAGPGATSPGDPLP